MTSICMIEICSTFTSKFQMLTLVFADWNMRCSVKSKLVSLFMCAESDLWTKISAACNTGYENKPSFNLDLLLALNMDASGASCSLLYNIVSSRVLHRRRGSR
jgi:hypothetical protein